MPDNINIKDSGGTVVPVSTVETTNLNGVTITPVEVQRLREGFGTGPTHQDVDASHPLPVTDAAVLAKLADPATQTTLAAVLAKLADPATQTTLAAVLGALGHLTDGTARIGGTVSTVPTGAGDVAGALTDGRKTVTTPGTAVALAASTTCKWVQVTALTTNTQQVNVGGSAVLATSGSSTGTPLAAGQSTTLPVSNLNLAFVDARVAGEGVSYTAGA